MNAQEVRIARHSSYEDPSLRDSIREILLSNKVVGSWRSNRDSSRHVVIKPNWIQEGNERTPGKWEALITNPAVVIGALSEVAALLQGEGIISICDAPHTYADFSAILRLGEMDEAVRSLQDAWPRLKIETLDLRREVWTRKEEVVVERKSNREDPRGYVRVQLGRDSLFYGHPGEGRYYGADYDETVVNSHHHGENQEYLLSGTAVRCDLFINLPKLKTHKKTGITCCLKNLVGINGDKNWLPHHTQGAPDRGGDEFQGASLTSQFESQLKEVLRHGGLNMPLVGTWAYRKARNIGKLLLGGSDRTVRNGNWHGNDTCWRMVLDLNRALLYSKAQDGSIRSIGEQKPYIAIVDGIVAGEGEGPLDPEPVPAGVLIGGMNPVAVDTVAAKLMGFDPRKIPMIREAFQPHPLPLNASDLDEISILDDTTGNKVLLSEVTSALGRPFKPHFGWSSHLLGE